MFQRMVCSAGVPEDGGQLVAGPFLPTWAGSLLYREEVLMNTQWLDSWTSSVAG